MLRILGSHKKLCGRVSRRDLLRVGTLGLTGISLADLMRWRESSAQAAQSTPAHFGQARSVIVLHLYGSPSQLEWADMKPKAPVEIRGELGGIESTLPGCPVCELYPNMAKVMDRTTVIRSMTHPYPIHGVAYALTGIPEIDVAMELSPNDPKHWPYFGSVVEYLDEARDGGAPKEVPPNMALPFPFSSRRVGEVPRAGPYAAFLGNGYNPVWTDFVGVANKTMKKVLGELTFNDPDPYIGLEPGSRFVVPAATHLQEGVALDRLDRRRSLLEQFDHARPRAEANAAVTYDRYQQMAFSLMCSDKLRGALDTRCEPDAVRDSYGPTLFGQACLTARRLVEAGSRVVTVMWDEFGLAGHAWDTHYDHFRRLKTALAPGLDQAWFGLINDLDQRGLLDETLVVCTSEHGRTPKINGQGGRDHWSRAYTTMLAGGGTARGRVVGATDSIGSDVTDRPVSPKDLQATMYHLLGIDHHTLLHDALGRQLPLVDGDVIHQALA